MEQKLIGEFIAECRKEEGLTQMALADKLNITDRAISKWENGRSLPDISIMLDLCKILNISVNELLSAKRIEQEDYKKQSEENLIKLSEQEILNNKKLLQLENVIGYTSSITFILLMFAIGSAVTNLLWQIILAVWAILVFIIGITYSLKIEHDAGYYECSYCHKKYVPSMKDIVFAKHKGRNRKLKCPYCHNKNYHTKVLNK